ncbi:hypothetical protein OAJ52_01790 [Bacteroidia bacterium]|nr:hypothetical protein [Bacteroidia bacterium]
MKSRNSFLILVTLIANLTYSQEALDFTITDTKGVTWNLFDELAKGKTVVLDLFFCRLYTVSKIYSSNGTIVF